MKKIKSLSNILAAGICSIFAIHAFAEIKIIDRGDLPPMYDFSIYKEGKKVTHRLAELVMYRSEPARIQLPMKVTENECGNNSQPMCKATASLASVGGKMIWREHPEAAKIGKKVTYKPLPAVDVGIEVFVYDALPFYSFLYEGFQPTEISCPHWDWLPEKSRKSGQWKVERWEAELNFDNPETKRTENVSVGGLEDVIFQIDQSNASVKEVGIRNAGVGFRIPFVVGTSYLIMKEDEEKTCQVTTQAGDQAKLVAEVQKLIANRKAFTVTKKQHDEIINYNELLSGILSRTLTIPAEQFE